VAAGIARTYGIDVSLVRVLWIIAGVFWIGIPAYVVAWIAIAPGDGDDCDADQPRDFGLLAALALIGIGIRNRARSLAAGRLHAAACSPPRPAHRRRHRDLVLRRPPDPGRAPDAVPRAALAPPRATGRQQPTAAASVAAPAPEDAADPGAEPTLPLTPSAWTQTAPWPTARDARREARAERRASRPHAFLGPLTVSILLIGAGVTTMLQALDVVDVNVTVALAVATCVVAAALLLSAWVGRARGLIFLGLLLVKATAVSARSTSRCGGFR
jgi:hypothetical protein